MLFVGFYRRKRSKINKYEYFNIKSRLNALSKVEGNIYNESFILMKMKHSKFSNCKLKKNIKTHTHTHILANKRNF